MNSYDIIVGVDYLMFSMFICPEISFIVVSNTYSTYSTEPVPHSELINMFLMQVLEETAVIN